ncbi:MAG: PHB depolymerase family esterase [Woeseiaceae bacterium]|nr:PHB depolymerase family esterase [Woeseiaceae bacterium]
MRIVCLLLATCLAACGGDEPAPVADARTFDIDSSRVTVSGVSSGGYMAGQLHVAHSALFSGVGIVAAGTWYCAAGDMTKALGPCMKGGDVDPESLAAYAQQAAQSGTIDSLDNLAGAQVWLFHGANDAIIDAAVVEASGAFYTANGASVTIVDDVPVVHGMPALGAAAGCDEFASPFLNDCNYDAAGELLGALYGELEPRVEAAGKLIEIPQLGADDAEMIGNAFLYVPAACAAGETCGLHVALHGCQQSSEYVGDAFASGAGYNEWAESNRLLVLYPQVASSKLMPLNPQGCWDWWGYTDENYATRSGVQVATIKAMIDGLAGAPL